MDKCGLMIMRWSIIFFFGVCLGCFFSPASGYAVENSQRITDREIIEALTRLEEGVKTNREMIVTIRTEMGSMRTEMGSIRTEMGSMRTEILGFMKWGFGLLFTGMLILVGFILWDRRSTLQPVREDIAELETLKVDRVIAAMRTLAKEDSRVAQVLRGVGLL